MAAWHRSLKADLGLRFMGLLLCGLAYVAMSHLVALHLGTLPKSPSRAAPRAAGAIAYGLATLGFLCGSAGCAMTTLGRHLFDEVEISARWRRTGMDRVSRRDRSADA